MLRLILLLIGRLDKSEFPNFVQLIWVLGSFQNIICFIIYYCHSQHMCLMPTTNISDKETASETSQRIFSF